MKGEPEESATALCPRALARKGRPRLRRIEKEGESAEACQRREGGRRRGGRGSRSGAPPPASGARHSQAKPSTTQPQQVPQSPRETGSPNSTGFNELPPADAEPREKTHLSKSSRSSKLQY